MKNLLNDTLLLMKITWQMRQPNRIHPKAVICKNGWNASSFETVDMIPMCPAVIRKVPVIDQSHSEAERFKCKNCVAQQKIAGLLS